MKNLAIIFVALIWCLGLGTGLSLALDRNFKAQLNLESNLIANNYEIGKELYLENCASCHIPIPPEVLPTETWREILEKPERHYGEQLKPTIALTTRLIWQYLSTFSRPLLPDEPQPKFIEQSRYFKALHPDVELPKPTTTKTCIACHPGAKELDYVSLSAEWEN